MLQFSTFLKYQVAVFLIVLRFTDARYRGLFNEYGYARSSGSCPVGYIEQCVPDDYYVPYYALPQRVSAGVSSAGGISGSNGIIGTDGLSGSNGMLGTGGISGTNGIIGTDGMSGTSTSSGFGGGGIHGGSYRSFAQIRSKCSRCPPGTVCIPSTGRCIFVFPG